MRDHILLFVNGRQHRVSGADAFIPLSNFLRERLALCGTKIVCSEGDCGSCSVLCGIADAASAKPTFKYAAIDSCIRFVYQLDGCNIVTVEGIADNEKSSGQLNSVQRAMIDCHGSQCGFCTPGFVVAMTGMLENDDQPSERQWRRGLTGNLCRCTGYTPIVKAGLQCSQNRSPKINECFPPAPMVAAMSGISDDEIRIEHVVGEATQTIYCPTSLEQATNFLADNPSAKIVAGATDVGVQFNKGFCHSEIWMDLNRVSALKHLKLAGNAIVAGACATWTDIENLVEKRLPQFYEIVSVFGSPQIRNVGTIGGNIINASPIADSLPFLFVTGAELQIVGKSGTRKVNINDFYQGYKTFDMQPAELLAQVKIPLPSNDEELRLYKISRRKDLDISSFTAAIRMKLDGEAIESCAIAYGAVGPVVLRLPETESFLIGRTFDLNTMEQAGYIAVKEIAPITDVRGGDEYRLQLARNVLKKFFHEVRAAGALA
ncbi:Nicotinate dehydrogenase FAD-subunit [Planctomycetes bacterium CA13]|uniref:Nicotinate dehydrogenase FAD-subunit n=1 Tax=Novipirellula herctigrandis TaxID=2527986 RepID=A0A5C5Z0X1_9BACT|nr:Nicotinate dehydrogenase FAD-subunit [Planctomycetes bacterium CA13]